MGIKEAFKKIYSTENALQKHTILFLLTGITSMFAVPLNEISQNKNLSFNEWLITMVLFLLCLVASFYTFGYVLRTTHNSYDNEKFDIMPEFSLENFKVIFKAMPLLLSWLGYFIVFGILIGITTIFVIMFKTFVPSAILFGILFITVMILPMVFADFAQNYNCKGLLGIHKPYTYLKKGFKDIALTILKLLPLFLIIHLSSALFSNFNNPVTYILIAIAGYIGIIYQLVLYNCFAQIIKDKFN